ncbi:hypothetical protein ANCCAN_27317 [Ancylostoma caninum]|uniref:Uncharacterized protein n=1 Tax=Ancylostoma caninum TaxID=29170 RepID=A0A368F4B3_ANCCA|nr:hypothetical protein ANCCAN_27317 [Ancylostoma caninum]
MEFQIFFRELTIDVVDSEAHEENSYGICSGDYKKPYETYDLTNRMGRERNGSPITPNELPHNWMRTHGQEEKKIEMIIDKHISSLGFSAFCSLYATLFVCIYYLLYVLSMFKNRYSILAMCSLLKVNPLTDLLDFSTLSMCNSNSCLYNLSKLIRNTSI